MHGMEDFYSKDAQTACIQPTLQKKKLLGQRLSCLRANFEVDILWAFELEKPLKEGTTVPAEMFIVLTRSL